MATIIGQRHQQIRFDRNHEITVTFLEVATGTGQHAKTLHHQRQGKTLVTAKGQYGALEGGGRIPRWLPHRVDRHAFGQQFAAPLAEQQIGRHESRGPQVDDKSLLFGRERTSNRVGTKTRLGATGWRDMPRRTHRMQTDQSGVRQHFNVKRTASANPAVVHADHGKTVLARLHNSRLRGVVHADHTDIVTTVEHRRDRGFIHRAHDATRQAQAPVLGNIQNFGQS